MRLLAIAAIAVLGAVLVASSAYAITLHPGDLVVARQRTPFFPSAVVHVDPLTGVRTVIVLLDNPGTPSAIAIDGNGDLLVAERSLAGSRAGGISIGDNDIVRIDPVTGAQSVVVLFPEEAGTIGVSPTGVAIDATGDLLVTYSQMSSFGVGGGVLRVDPLTGDVTTTLCRDPWIKRLRRSGRRRDHAGLRPRRRDSRAQEGRPPRGRER
jgi:hypothetical protein